MAGSENGIGDNTIAQIIRHLNNLLKTKLTGINQYFLHARMLKHGGDVRLADYAYKTSIEIMKHSDMLIEHILTLKGFPALQELGQLNIGKTPEEMLRNDLALSQLIIQQAKEALSLCHSADATALILRRILEGQKERMDFIQHELTNPHTERDVA